MVLINGTEGIGTGFSTKIPPYNPIEVIYNLKRLLNNQNYKYMRPWWDRFTGKVNKIDKHNFETQGIYKREKNMLIITELPIGEWTSNYKEYLEKLLEKEAAKKNRKSVVFLGYKSNNTDTKVYFELKFAPGSLDKIDDLEKKYHLIKKYSTTNMHLYSSNGCIKKYKTVKDIMTEYFDVRLKLYHNRKEHQLKVLKQTLDMISYKVKFIMMILEKKIKINNKKKKEVEKQLIKYKFPKLNLSETSSKKDYQYLLGMPIYSLTYEKIEELKKKEKARQTEYNNLQKKSVKEIWEEELDELVEAYHEWHKDKLTVKEVVKKSKKKTKKKK